MHKVVMSVLSSFKKKGNVIFAQNWAILAIVILLTIGGTIETKDFSSTFYSLPDKYHTIFYN